MISYFLPYITYFTVTVVIRFIQRYANLAAAGTLSLRDSLPAAGMLYKTQIKTTRKCLRAGKPARLAYS